ncbi:MAG: DUF2800 domain-containing protein [Clostridia bacterium]|nr:DUF2800 domain-containing protein [Clostridia bacterium]
MAPSEHAMLSASSAYRWMKCTAAPRYEALFEDTTSSYAEAGTLAHAICELKLLKKFTTSVKPKEFKDRLKELQSNELYDPEMDKTSDQYIEHLTELAMTYPAPPHVNAEVRVDLSAYVPEGFGTCDCIMIGGDTLTIVDYKHGKGVPVSAHENPQMRLYALGALQKYRPIYGDKIKQIRMCIEQPRVRSELETEEITVEELLAWGEKLKPIAQEAFSGENSIYIPGDHCQFCRGKARCKARAEVNISLRHWQELDRNTLSLEQIGAILKGATDLAAWAKDLEDFALSQLLDGYDVPGWKAVEGRSNRAFSDQDAAFAAITAAGYDEALLYERKPITLSAVEKLLGKKDFAATVGQYVIKPPGKPTLVPDSDKRPAFRPAAEGFAPLD